MCIVKKVVKRGWNMFKFRENAKSLMLMLSDVCLQHFFASPFTYVWEWFFPPMCFSTFVVSRLQGLLFVRLRVMCKQKPKVHFNRKHAIVFSCRTAEASLYQYCTPRWVTLFYHSILPAHWSNLGQILKTNSIICKMQSAFCLKCWFILADDICLHIELYRE